MFMVKRGVMHEADQKTFFNISFNCLLLFSLDILWVNIDGSTFSHATTLNKVINAAYFAQSGVLCYFWSRYSLFLSSSQFKVWNVHRVLFALPMIIIGIMSIASIWTGWFFTVDPYEACEFPCHCSYRYIFLLPVADHLVVLAPQPRIRFIGIGYNIS